MIATIVFTRDKVVRMVTRRSISVLSRLRQASYAAIARGVNQERKFVVALMSFLASSLVTACRDNDLPATLADAVHVDLPAAACSIAVSAVADIAKDAREISGLQSVVAGSSSDGPVIGVTAYDGLYVATLSTKQPVAFTKLAAWGVDPGTLTRLGAITKKDDGSWQFLDIALLRRTTLAANGRYVEHLPLRPPVGTDIFGINKRGVYAFSSSTTDLGYVRSRGVLHHLVEDVRFVADTATLVTPSRHSTAGGAELSLAQRPLEHDPIIVANDAGDMVIQSSDSLELTFLPIVGRVTRLRGSGHRVAFLQSEIDSAALAYGRRLLPNDPERPARDAKSMLFAKRKAHQLIDAVQMLAGSRVVVRRTRACDGRQLWYVVGQSGTVEQSFTTAVDLDPVGTRGDTLFLRHTTGLLRFGWMVVGGGSQARR